MPKGSKVEDFLKAEKSYKLNAEEVKKVEEMIKKKDKEHAKGGSEQPSTAAGGSQQDPSEEGTPGKKRGNRGGSPKPRKKVK